MEKNNSRYTDEDIVKYSKEVFSVAGLLRKLGMRPVGGNYVTIKKHLQRLEVDTTHWTGQGWSKGNQLKDWTQYKNTSSLRNPLINKKGNICECCGLTEWCGVDVPLEVHHIDGDNTNNKYENLQLLCCNCHAITDNWRGRANKNPSKKCIDCGGNVARKSTRCRGCYVIHNKNGEVLTNPTTVCSDCGKGVHDGRELCASCVGIRVHAHERRVERPPYEQLMVEIDELGYSGAGRKYGVSDNAIRKWVRLYEKAL